MEHRETEIKLRMDAPRDRIAARLRALGATLHLPRHFEDNYILDDESGTLARSGTLLRVRLAPGGDTLTYKGPRRIVRGAKSRLELETSVSDGKTILKLLERIGLLCRFRYQKYRAVYRRPPFLVALDETPIGDYVEIEGAPVGISSLAAKLGYRQVDFITKSYFELFLEYRKTHGSKSENMIFEMRA